MESKKRSVQKDFEEMEDGRKVLTRKGFEGMVAKAMQTLIENTMNSQSLSLKPMYHRMNDAEFDNYLEKERERLLQDEALKRYDLLKQHIWPSFPRAASGIADQLEAAENIVDWTEYWTKSTWKTVEFIEDYLRGIAVEGALWATTEFKKNYKKLTFEDWKSGNWPPLLIPVREPFDQYLSRYPDGEYKLYSLSGDEYQKIIDAQNAMFEKQVKFFLEDEIERFERTFFKSLDKEGLVESEREKIEKRFKDKDYSEPLFFSNPNGGTFMLSGVHRLAREEGQDTNLYPPWYKLIVEKGEDGSSYLEPKYEKGETHPAVVVYVLHQYREYLKVRLTRQEPEEKVQPTAIPFQGKVIQKVLALFYHYQHESGDLKSFTDRGLQKKEWTLEISTKHGVGQKNFEMAYNDISGKQSKRLAKTPLKNFKAVVEMLSNYPKAKALAIGDLNEKNKNDG